MADPNLSELVTTTAYKRKGEVADSVSDSNAGFYKMREKGNMKKETGGRQIVVPIDYGENSTVASFDGYDVLDNTPQTVISAAVYDWKEYAGAISFSRREAEIQNSGKEAKIKLVASRFKNLRRSFANKMDTDFYGDGTGNGGKNITGLAALVDQTPTTGTVGGIDRSVASNAFWRNIAVDYSTDVGAIASSSNILEGIAKAVIQTTRGPEKIDLFLFGNDYYEYLWAALQSQQRFAESKMADAGFEVLKHAGADCVLAGGKGSHIADKLGYGLNTDYIELITHSGSDFAPLGKRAPINQAATVEYVVWAGELCISAAWCHAVLKD